MQHDDVLLHSHEPNPIPPGPDTSLQVLSPQGTCFPYTVPQLRQLPAMVIDHCYIVSTGHGTSGPFCFQGPRLVTVAHACGITAFRCVTVVSGDGFGTRLQAEEARNSAAGQAVILALVQDGRLLTREAGLVRLIVPAERDDALKQVKWVARIKFEL